MSDPKAILAEMDAAVTSANGRDQLEVSGVTLLGANSDLGQVAVALRRLASLLPADPLQRRVLRNRAITILKSAKIGDAGGLVDAAFPRLAVEDKRQGQAVALLDPELWPEPVDGDGLLRALLAVVERYVALPPGGALAAALWVLHTHAIAAADVAPYFAITSPTKQCGKTTLIQLLRRLVRRPISTGNLSPSVLFRMIAANNEPTILIDEADSFGQLSEELRGLLNTGNGRDDALVWRTEGDEHEPRGFSVFGPKALAGIGDLPDTVMDRAIVLEMRRKSPQDKRPRMRRRELAAELAPLLQQAARWAHDNTSQLADARPALLESLSDRQCDTWEPLFAIADAIGGAWAEQARLTALYLCGQRVAEPQDVRELLLVDLATVFGDEDRRFSADLAADLAKLEGRPWPEFGRSRKPLTANALARLLRPFGIRPRTLRSGDVVGKGYLRTDVEPLWVQYRVPTTVTPVTIQATSALSGNSASVTGQGDVTVASRANSLSGNDCNDVTVAEHSGEVKEPPELWDGPPPHEPPPDEDADDELDAPDSESPKVSDGRAPAGLEVTVLGAGRYQVTGGAEPHVVELGAGTEVRCDCRDFAFRGRVRDCKHVAAVRRYRTRAADDLLADQDDVAVVAVAGPDDGVPHWRRAEEDQVPVSEQPGDEEIDDP